MLCKYVITFFFCLSCFSEMLNHSKFCYICFIGPQHVKTYVMIAYVFIRPYWRCYFPNTQAIIYVVDSSDTDRLVVAKEEFHAILEVWFTSGLPYFLFLLAFQSLLKDKNVFFVCFPLLIVLNFKHTVWPLCLFVSYYFYPNETDSILLSVHQR